MGTYPLKKIHYCEIKIYLKRSPITDAAMPDIKFPPLPLPSAWPPLLPLDGAKCMLLRENTLETYYVTETQHKKLT